MPPQGWGIAPESGPLPVLLGDSAQPYHICSVYDAVNGGQLSQTCTNRPAVASIRLTWYFYCKLMRQRSGSSLPSPALIASCPTSLFQQIEAEINSYRYLEPEKQLGWRLQLWGPGTHMVAAAASGGRRWCS